MAHERISIRPDVMFGKPVIKGTRIPVERILRKLAAGKQVEDIEVDHPNLESDDIYAAINFAADEVANEDIDLAAPSEQ